MIAASRSQGGFSAVELLITLFVAAAFVATGYQLYSVIISDGAAARLRAKADNIAYEALRRYSEQATFPCSVVTPSPAPSIPAGSNLPNATMSVSITCPYGTTSTTSRIEAVVNYGTPQEEVAHASYVSQ
jgi:Tfp pilus assembly protein PilE